MEAARILRVRAVFLRLLALEVLINIPVIGAWVSNGLADAAVLFGFHGARVALLWVGLWRMLEPLRRWRAEPNPSDETLIAADDCLQSLFVRFIRLYIPAMAIASGAALWVRIASDAGTPAPTELVFGILFVFVAVGLNSSVIFARMRGLMDLYMAELGPALAARKLYPARVRRSSRRELVTIAGVLAFSTLTAGAASGFNYDARRVQAETTLELRDQLEHAANQLRQEGQFDVAGVELVTASELPPTLSPTGADYEFLGGYEIERDMVVVGLAVSGEGWLIAEAPLPYDLWFGIINLTIFEAIVVFLVASTFAWLGRALFEPLARLDDASRDMAEHGDLQALARVYPARDDEVGSLVRNFNDMLNLLDDLAGAARVVSGGKLSVTLHHRGDLHDAFRFMLTQLRQMVQSLRSVAFEVTSASTEIHARMQAQAEASTRHAEAVEHSSQTIVELADAARQISDKSSQVVDQAETNLVTNDTVATKIAGLDDQAAGIAKLLDQIRDIAARSDLLALNGSLEATRAGEAGRGFALVATEMRRLAERITRVVNDVEVCVEAIGSVSAETVSATARSRALARSSAEAAREISALTRAQREGSERASSAAQATAVFVRDSATGVRQASDAAEGLRALVAELERLTHEFDLSDQSPSILPEDSLLSS